MRVRVVRGLRFLITKLKVNALLIRKDNINSRVVTNSSLLKLTYGNGSSTGSFTVLDAKDLFTNNAIYGIALFGMRCVSSVSSSYPIVGTDPSISNSLIFAINSSNQVASYVG